MIAQMIFPSHDSFLGVLLEHGDFVGFTFLLGTLAMWGAGLFFLFERAQVPGRWRTSLLVASLVTLIAGCVPSGRAGACHSVRVPSS